MPRRRGRFGDGLAVLSGARPDVLEAVPGARAKFVALGGVLLSTGGLAVLSAAFAVHMALGVWWPLALLVGLGAAGRRATPARHGRERVRRVSL